MAKHVQSGAFNARVWFGYERPDWTEKCCHCNRHLSVGRGRFRLTLCPAAGSPIGCVICVSCAEERLTSIVLLSRRDPYASSARVDDALRETLADTANALAERADGPHDPYLALVAQARGLLGQEVSRG